MCYLRHFWHKTHFPWHSDRGVSQLCEREELFNYVEALWHVVVSNIQLLSILSCYRARREISPPFLAQKPISLGIPTEEALSCASAKNYSIMSKHNGTPSSQISIFCRFCRVIVRAAGFLRHFWHNTHFPWRSDRGGITLHDGNTKDINNC